MKAIERPEEEMRDSGIKWIGKIPKTWGCGKTLYYLVMPITDGPHITPQLYDDGVPFVSAEAVSCGNGRIDFSHIRGYISEKFYQECCKKYVPQIDDIYMIKSGATTGRVAIVDTNIRFTIWSPLAVFRANKDVMIPKFMFYAIQSPSYQKQVEEGWTFGTQQNIGMRTLEKLKIPAPNMEEQRQIISYLDDKCSKIDFIISESQKSIDEYKKLKQSIITEAVTKGLDKYVQMKDSGLKYLKEIPKHWKVLRIANLYSEYQETGRTDLPILMVSINSGISDKEVGDEDRVRKVIRSDDKSVYKVVHPNYLVYNMMRAWQGAFGASKVDGLVSPAYVVAKPKIDINSHYMEALLRTPNLTEVIRGRSYGVADFRLRLYWPYFKDIYVCVPPVEEQNAIMENIEQLTEKADALIAEKQSLIDDLEAYKKSLIYEVVTGKRKVVS